MGGLEVSVWCVRCEYALCVMCGLEMPVGSRAVRVSVVCDVRPLELPVGSRAVRVRCGVCMRCMCGGLHTCGWDRVRCVYALFVRGGVWRWRVCRVRCV